MYTLYYICSFISQFLKIPWQCLACLRQPPGLCFAFGFRSQYPGDILSTFQEWFGTASKRVQRSSEHSQGCLISISLVTSCIWWLYWAIYLAQTFVIVHDILISFVHVMLSSSLEICLILSKSVPEQFN